MAWPTCTSQIHGIRGGAESAEPEQHTREEEERDERREGESKRAEGRDGVRGA